jgi:putative sterol carrier protein
MTFKRLSALVPRLNEGRTARSLMEVFPKTIQFRLDGEDGPFYLGIADGRATLARGVAPKIDIEVEGSTGEFAKVLTDRVDMTWPIAEGHIRVVKGKISELTLLNRILWAAERK